MVARSIDAARHSDNDGRSLLDERNRYFIVSQPLGSIIFSDKWSSLKEGFVDDLPSCITENRGGADVDDSGHTEFNREPDNPFEGKVDLGNIVLIGHSRGGEAVANAAAFNRLRHYPDDATLAFDFGYDIRGIVSIAPVDGQYLPTGRKVVVEDVSYLTFHGSHDGDVTSFHGLRIYDRLKFNDPRDFHFKSAVYVYRANHGQWNTVWGPNDNGPRSARILDLRGLIPEQDQRRFAEIYISAFLEVVTRGDKRYLPIFRLLSLFLLPGSAT